jgi:hypothetical protein
VPFTVVPVWKRTHSDELAVDVARIVGYRKVDGEGWRGPVRSTMKDARRDEPERMAK